MILSDKVYGKFEIDEPVILELLKSPALKRLKNISQYEIPDKYNHHKNFSRYEHSLGVMLLLGKVGATLEEQIAGLLHDVSHFAFSHITDWVFKGANDNSENLHDTLHHRFLENSDIPTILKKYRYSLTRLTNEHNFSLLEKDTPELCADRVDYALREMVYWYNKNLAKRVVDKLINFNGQLVFLDKTSALEFAKAFLELQRKHWGGKQSIRRYSIFSNVLKFALESKIITKGDLYYKDETYVLKKIENTKNIPVKSLLRILKSKSLAGNIPGKRTKVIKKFRYVDPLFLQNRELKRLSVVDKNFRRLIRTCREINEQGVVI